ncbi:MAG: hypothetical protein U5O39_08055 [Gammaproteobacteria bacterium]|nr:hypothetical protein [Gammaproteobacteria bacterium]
MFKKPAIGVVMIARNLPRNAHHEVDALARAVFRFLQALAQHHAAAWFDGNVLATIERSVFRGRVQFHLIGTPQVGRSRISQARQNADGRFPSGY